MKAELIKNDDQMIFLFLDSFHPSGPINFLSLFDQLHVHDRTIDRKGKEYWGPKE